MRMSEIDQIKLEALSRAKGAVNGSSALAKALEQKITPQAISQWKQVPAERVLDVERITGVPRHELRPDIYPAPSERGAA
jgi:DNA-binding transcriptional regulator YdaS (Cro superfamily)